MHPKKLSALKSISSIGSTDSRNRINRVGDLVTTSQAALSSQATVYTQRTQATQEPNNNYQDNQDMEFNRQDMSEVFISKQEEDIVNTILELARKGKVNSKNAFEIPIKVLNSQQTTSINNKFWKFASQLLGASMSIYDKRVQNMYMSTSTFQSKLSRIGFQIKDSKADKQSQERLDDVNADQQRRKNKNKSQRHELLNISIQDFYGNLDVDDETIIGGNTLERKDKLDIKHIQNKFIADPTFLRTQKMFDSFSLKSLMLNIFPISTDLDVRIFHQSDLQWQNMKRTSPFVRQYQRMNVIKGYQNDGQQEQSQNRSNEDIQMDGKRQYDRDFQTMQKSQIKQQTITLTNKISNADFGNSALSFDFQKHLSITRNLIRQNQLFDQINKFIPEQTDMRKDYLKRNNLNLMERRNNEERNNDKSFNDERQDNQNDEQNQLSYGQLINKEKQEFIELFREYDQNFDQNQGVHHFQQIRDGAGLYQSNQTHSQPFAFNNESSDSFLSMYNQSGAVYQAENNSMPISYQQSFFSWDQKNNLIQPIMPWEIQFKNLKLIKKKKVNSKNQKKQSKKSKSSNIAIVDFSFQILDAKQILKNGQIKKKFQNQKSYKFVQNNLVTKQFDNAHAEYHKKVNPNHKSTEMIAGKSNFKVQMNGYDKQNDQNHSNFVFDVQNVHMEHMNKQKMNQGGFQQEQTRMHQDYEREDDQVYDSGANREQTLGMTKNTSFFGNMMGVNNIREIKKMIQNQINQKGCTNLAYMNKILVNLSPQQLFTIFLHLTNQHQYIITNQNQEEDNVILTKPSNIRNRNNRYQDQEDIEI